MSQRNLKAMVFGSLFVLSTIDLANAESAGFPSFRPDIPEESPRGWTICNESKESSVWVAYSYLDGGVWVSKGWRKIPRNSCSQMLTQITNRYVYVYAEGEAGKWEGTTKLCVHPTDKFFVRDTSCPPSYALYGFQKVDTGGNASFRTLLK